jgi:hypothetical protein
MKELRETSRSTGRLHLGQRLSGGSVMRWITSTTPQFSQLYSYIGMAERAWYNEHARDNPYQ